MHTRSKENLQTNVVRLWESIFERTYRTSVSSPAPTFAGWISGYTGQPIPESEMQEWLNGTIERIEALQPKRVLEIGCGQGLLLQSLAPRCEVYVGTDFSESAITHTRQWVAKRQDLEHVVLLHRPATDVGGLAASRFDTVILNSVIQYFPSINYLIDVLQSITRLLSPGGDVFIGDVRHLGSLRTFHSAVQLQRAEVGATVGQLRTRIAHAVSHDKELTIDPKFFHLLPGRLAGITATTVQLKRGEAHNEMTRHRYDVHVRVGDQLDDLMVCDLLNGSSGMGSLSDLEEALKSRRWNAVSILGVPDARVAREIAACQLIETSDENLPVGRLRQLLSETTVEAVDPDMLWKLADVHEYDAILHPGGEGTFDVRLLDRLRIDTVRREPARAADTSIPWASYANDPFGTQ